MKFVGYLFASAVLFIGGMATYKYYGKNIEEKCEEWKNKYKEKKEALEREGTEDDGFDVVD